MTPRKTKTNHPSAEDREAWRSMLAEFARARSERHRAILAIEWIMSSERKSIDPFVYKPRGMVGRFLRMSDDLLRQQIDPETALRVGRCPQCLTRVPNTRFTLHVRTCARSFDASSLAAFIAQIVASRIAAMSQRPNARKKEKKNRPSTPTSNKIKTARLPAKQTRSRVDRAISSARTSAGRVTASAASSDRDSATDPRNEDAMTPGRWVNGGGFESSRRRH